MLDVSADPATSLCALEANITASVLGSSGPRRTFHFSVEQHLLESRAIELNTFLYEPVMGVAEQTFQEDALANVDDDEAKAFMEAYYYYVAINGEAGPPHCGVAVWFKLMSEHWEECS